MLEVFLKRTDSGEEYPLTDRTTIGRYVDNDIVFSDHLISRHHCVLYRKGSDFLVKDLESSNGTFLNDQPIQECAIADGDRIKVGLVELDVVIQYRDVEEIDAEPAFNSIIFDPFFRKKITGIHVYARQAPATDYFLECDSVSMLGRMDFCNIPINNPYVSRNNTTIDVREHKVMIADASSKNGTYVNGERIINSQLLDGDTFNVAGNFDFDVVFEYDQSNSLSSIATIGNLHMIDIVDDREKILEWYDTKYGNQVLLEVERQTYVFCNEVEALLTTDDQGLLSTQSVTNFLHGVSRAAQVMPVDTVQRMSRENASLGQIQPALFQGVAQMTQQVMASRLVYFEGGYEESKQRIHINGLVVRFLNGFQLVLFGLPVENILYLIYAAGWLERIRLKNDKTV